MANESTSPLARRGLLLLAMMTALVIAVWIMLLRGTRQEVPTEKRRPELLVALAASPVSGLAGVSWASLVEIGQLLPSAPGWEVRYNATIALARRGSKVVPFDLLAEMLDEDRQMKNFRARLQDGRNVPDEAAARRTVLNTLKAFADWHKHADTVRAVGTSNPGLQQVYAAIDKLTRSPNLVVRTEASNVQLSLKKG
jgi:hypothetical protein